ncbi:MAG: nucleotidyltransferase family protein [Alphaproteobacteria bacterium]|nr:nucleotidyltransferase family protein [Alphaproteobacteria bacterium]
MTPEVLIVRLMQDRTVGLALKASRSLELQDWAIAGGFVRSRVWDQIGGVKAPPLPGDVDLVHLDRDDPSESADRGRERLLAGAFPVFQWSVKNQARMHHRHKDPPYASTEAAMRRWLATVDAVGLTVDATRRVRLLAPFGLEDLLDFVLRPTPGREGEIAAIRERAAARGWFDRWPRLRILGEAA